ncbi:hypothetical protein [Blastococcus sp. CCUG 61487]|uniref:hypothetical protein n=1 Tax=Blastococcus sp. CCUG 61487 TaxID=1840703 RepID=UPI0010BF9FE8|nr:hypothetical protein [Blastococcus sp. CCUG 61487]
MSPAEPGAVRGREAGWGWTLLLPPGWATIPSEPIAGRRAVTKLLDRRLAHLPRDRVVRLRRQLEAELRGLVAQARESGAGSLHAHLALMRGLPVSATCTPALLRGGPDDPRLLELLTTALDRDDDVVAVDVRPVAGLAAVRRRRHRLLPVEGTGRTVRSTSVDWAVPLPDGDGALLLSFATVTEPVAEELVLLFDAIAQSLELAPC